MDTFRRLLLSLTFTLLLHADRVEAAEPVERKPQSDWNVSAGTGLIVAPAFTGAKSYSLLAVPDIRVAYKNIFFVNVRDGIGYAVINQDGWRVGPVATYAFSRSEKGGGSIFKIAGGDKSALQGMGDVNGTVSLGGFVEYSLNPYKFQLHLHKGISGHEGFVAEGRVGYGGVLTGYGPPLIYSFGPHIRFADQKFINAYWGVSEQQSARSGLDRYRANAGITSYGFDFFALVPLTSSISASIIAGFDRLAPVVADSPLVRVRGAENQAVGGLFVSYRF